MSVINKMLRDLDHRQANNTPLPINGTVPIQFPPRQANTLSGSPWDSQGAGEGARRWVLPAVLCATVLLALGAWVWWPANLHGAPVAVALIETPAPTPVPSSAAAASAQAASGPMRLAAAEPVVVPARAPVVAVAVNASPGTVALRMEDALSAGQAVNAPLPTSAPASATVATAPFAAAPVAMVSSSIRPKALASNEHAQALPAVAPSVVAAASAGAYRTSTTPRPTEVAPSIQRQQEAGGDALAQAQNLWNAGSRDAAMELMQQAVAAAERTAKAGGGPGGSAVLTPLVREMARMQLAEGRYGAVWDLLTRLEPLLGNQADLWAIRANAAQRLGRHQDSVHAYMVALQSRPDEQRWLLGSAVSLAALGQTTAASEMAEKARTAGPISKELMAYLRQTGVVVRD